MNRKTMLIAVALVGCLIVNAVSGATFNSVAPLKASIAKMKADTTKYQYHGFINPVWIGILSDEDKKEKLIALIQGKAEAGPYFNFKYYSADEMIEEYRAAAATNFGFNEADIDDAMLVKLIEGTKLKGQPANYYTNFLVAGITDEKKCVHFEPNPNQKSELDDKERRFGFFNGTPWIKWRCLNPIFQCDGNTPDDVETGEIPEDNAAPVVVAKTTAAAPNVTVNNYINTPTQTEYVPTYTQQGYVPQVYAGDQGLGFQIQAGFSVGASLGSGYGYAQNYGGYSNYGGYGNYNDGGFWNRRGHGGSTYNIDESTNITNINSGNTTTTIGGGNRGGNHGGGHNGGNGGNTGNGGPYDGNSGGSTPNNPPAGDVPGSGGSGGRGQIQFNQPNFGGSSNASTLANNNSGSNTNTANRGNIQVDRPSNNPFNTSSINSDAMNRSFATAQNPNIATVSGNPAASSNVQHRGSIAAFGNPAISNDQFRSVNNAAAIGTNSAVRGVNGTTMSMATNKISARDFFNNPGAVTASGSRPNVLSSMNPNRARSTLASGNMRSVGTQSAMANYRGFQNSNATSYRPSVISAGNRSGGYMPSRQPVMSIGRGGGGSVGFHGNGGGGPIAVRGRK